MGGHARMPASEAWPVHHDLAELEQQQDPCLQMTGTRGGACVRVCVSERHVCVDQLSGGGTWIVYESSRSGVALFGPSEM